MLHAEIKVRWNREEVCPVVDRRRIELLYTACKAVILPLNYQPMKLCKLTYIPPVAHRGCFKELTTVCGDITLKSLWCWWNGIEPSTSRLQGGYSTTELHQRFRMFFILYIYSFSTLLIPWWSDLEDLNLRPSYFGLTGKLWYFNLRVPNAALFLWATAR